MADGGQHREFHQVVKIFFDSQLAKVKAMENLVEGKEAGDHIVFSCKFWASVD